VSNSSPFNRKNQLAFPVIPRGEILASYDTYYEAQQAVDVLARGDFPVRQISIIGTELKSVERVTGKLSYGRAAAAGALIGVWLGLFFGILLILFAPTTSFAFLIAAVLIGAGFGMLFGLVSYAINRRRRDFTSIMQVIATKYSVIVDGQLINKARKVLGVHTPPTQSPVTPDPEVDPAAHDAQNDSTPR
jgi:hypothetical protein